MGPRLHQLDALTLNLESAQSASKDTEITPSGVQHCGDQGLALTAPVVMALPILHSDFSTIPFFFQYNHFPDKLAKV